MGLSLESIEDGLKDFLCGNIFVEAGVAAAGLEAVRRSNFYGAALVSVASYAFSKACENRGFNPDVHLPSAPPFQGGQCSARYTFQVRVYRANGSSATTGLTGWGPIGGFRIIEDGGSPSGYLQILWHGGGGSPTSSPAWEFLPFGGGFGSDRAISFSVLSLFRADGQPDNCGSLPGGDINIVGDPSAPLIPRDVPLLYPDPRNPGNSVEVNVPVTNFSVEKLLGVDGPLVNFDVGGVRVSLDLGDDSATPEDKNNDLAELTKRQIEKLLELGEELEGIRECVCRPEIELESLYLPATVCSTDSQPSQILRSFMVPKGSYSEEDILLFNQSADLASIGCEGPTIFAVPDSYNQRRQHSPPTLILIFRKENSRAYHSYSIPNPANTSRDQEIPIQEFMKGNILGSIYFSDNSACMANCASREEAERVISAFSSLILPSFFGPDSYIRTTERRGNPIEVARMSLTSSAFFPEGNRSLKPAWRRRYTPGI